MYLNKSDKFYYAVLHLRADIRQPKIIKKIFLNSKIFLQIFQGTIWKVL